MGRKRRQRRGFALLLALLVMAAVTAVATGLANSMLSNVFASRDLDAVVGLYFAAESGIERSLIFAREQRFGNASLGATRTALDGAAFQNVGILGGRYSYSIGTTPSTPTIRPFGVTQDRTATVDLFDPDNFMAGSAFQSVKVTFEAMSGASTLPWLEATFTRFVAGMGTVTLDPNDASYSFIATDPYTAANRLDSEKCGTAAGGCCLKAPGDTYRLRLTALYADAVQVRVTPYSIPNCPVGSEVPINSELNIRSAATGTGLTEVTQAISVSTNWLVPSSPLFDYALFSQKQLQK